MADIISELSGADDATLGKKMGLDIKLEEGRKLLGQLDTLTGDERKTAVTKVEAMFAPNVYPGELQYIYDSAKRSAKKNGADMLASACGCDMDNDGD